MTETNWIVPRHESRARTVIAPMLPERAAEPADVGGATEPIPFRVLGPLEVLGGENCDLTPSAPRLRQILSLLLARSNRLVQIYELIDEMWGEAPPATALPTLQTYIYRLRRQVVEAGRFSGTSLWTKPKGYVLSIRDDDLDVRRFEQLSVAGQEALDAGRAEEASGTLSRALALWRGEPFAGVEAGELLGAQITRLVEDRLWVLELRIEADLQLARHHEVVSELKALCSTHPLHEGMHAKVIVALAGSGRRYEALEVYQQFRRRFVDELGLEPSPALSRVHQRVLSAEVALQDNARPVTAIALPDISRGVVTASGDIVRGGPAEPPAHLPAGAEGVTRADWGSRPPLPAQLPPSIADFACRAAVLREREQWLAAMRAPSSAVPVLWITGMPGVGKTTLAVNLAHRVRLRYPDGQLFANLRGTAAVAADVQEVLARFLLAAGIDPARIPDDADECGKIFRTWSAGRSLLVVLDNAADATQVVPLLPGSELCSVIVTSLAPSLPGAETLVLDPLTAEEGGELLARIIGGRRAAQEPAAAERIVRFCGGLPLTLRAVGTRLLSLPGWPLSELALNLENAKDRLDELTVPGLDLRTAYDGACRGLSKRDEAALHVVSVVGPGEFTASQVASVLGCEVRVADRMLVRMAERHLLQVTSENGQRESALKYQVHELFGIYARERLALSGRESA